MARSVEDTPDPVGDAERANIDAHIRALEKQILDLKTKRNEISRICQLPPELLSRIFILHSQAKPLSPQDFRHGTRNNLWIHVTNVCKHWRDVATNCPRMWSEINFHMPNLARMMVERSKHIPVTLTIPLYLPRSSEPYANRILSQPHRLRRLVTETAGGEDSQKLVRGMTSAAPNLEGINMATRGGFDSFLPDNFLGGVTPKLKEVRLMRWKIPWTSPLLTGLTTLYLEDTSIGGTLPIFGADFVSAFERMPHLRTLSMTRVELPFTDATTPRIARLPRLKQFSFNGDPDDCARALKALALPTSALLRLSFPSPTINISADLPSALIASWLSAPLSTTRPGSSHLRTLHIFDGQLHGWFDTVPELGPWYVTHRISGFQEPPLRVLFPRQAHGVLFALPLDQVQQINMMNETLSQRLWDHIGSLPRLTTLWAENHTALGLIERLKGNPPPPSIEGNPTNPPTSLMPFAHVEAIYLLDVDFAPLCLYNPTPDVDAFLDILIWRCEHGGAIQQLVMEQCCSLYEDDVDRIREVVVNVEWDGQEMERDVSDDEENDVNLSCHCGQCSGDGVDSDDDDWL